MKNKLIKLTFILGIISGLFTSCEKDEKETSIIPEKFKINIPSSISDETTTTLKSTQSTALSGAEMYEHLTNFIAIGEGAADIVQTLILHLFIFKINDVTTFTYISDDDRREKEVVVLENQAYDSVFYEYSMEVTDVASQNNGDGGVAFQVYWNTNPTVGVAILKPYNIDRRDGISVIETIYRIEYSEAGSSDYNATMEIDIVGLPAFGLDEYEVDNLKMFVGKKGNIVDVFGNSNHPNTTTLTDGKAINWAFVASANEETNIGVAEVGLPNSNIDSDSRSVLLDDYNMKDVLSSGLEAWFIDTYNVAPSKTDLDAYLINAAAPGFFNATGFVQAGSAPNDNYGGLTPRLENLTPYNPVNIVNLSVNLGTTVNANISSTNR